MAPAGVYDAIWASDGLYWLMQAAMLLPAWAFWSAVLAPGFGAEEAMRRAVLIGGLAGIMGFLGAILTLPPTSCISPMSAGRWPGACRLWPINSWRA